MTSVLHFRKELLDPPVERAGAGISIRSIVVPDDVAGWLKLREPSDGRTYSPSARVEPGRLRRSDARETLVAKRLDVAGNRSRRLVSRVIGAVTLGVRTGADATVPIVHWLLVDPAWRRRGVGQMLMSRLESAAWEVGYRQVELETHAKWKDAVAFYQSMGYAPVRDRSPR